MSKRKDGIDDRMKRYELVPRNSLTPRTPVIVRIDGRAFHTYTVGFAPFDAILQDAMLTAALHVSNEMQGFEVFYHQSDEVSFLLTDYAAINSSNWFKYVTQKVVSIAASVMTAHFNMRIQKTLERFVNDMSNEGNPLVDKYTKIMRRVAYFDARAFNIPKEDVANYFLWRAKDWERNSLNMYASQFFTPKQLDGKNSSDRHELLHGIGKNWAKDVLPSFRNGTFFTSKDRDHNSGVQARYADVALLIDPLVYKPKDGEAASAA